MITADVVARAIVTACRSTNEDPECVATGTPTLRARHYAVHALVRVFPDVEATIIVRLCGIPEGQLKWWRNSKAQVFSPRSGDIKCGWWNPRVFQGVVAAVFDQAALVPPEPDDKPKRVDLKPVAIRSVPRAAPAPPRFESPPAMPRPFASPGKRDLLAELAQAVRNTAAMQIKDD